MKCGMVNIVGSIKILFCILNSFVWNDFGISRSQDENGSWFHYLYISLEMEGQVKRIALWDTVLVCHIMHILTSGRYMHTDIKYC